MSTFTARVSSIRTESTTLISNVLHKIELGSASDDNRTWPVPKKSTVFGEGIDMRNPDSGAAADTPTDDTLSVPRQDAARGIEASYWSTALKREQTYVAMVPKAALEGVTPCALLLLLHGHGGAPGAWPRYTRISRYLADLNLAIVCPEGRDGWYTNGFSGEDRYEDDILSDLMPTLEDRLPLLPYPSRAVCGSSMGGYGAVKLALKYPGRFRAAASHSGAFDVTTRSGQHPIFGDPYADVGLRRRENPAWLAEQALCEPAAQRPALLLDCGLSDPLLEANRTFSSHLTYIGYGHTYREMRGHHTWPYFDRAFKLALPEIARIIGVFDDAPPARASRGARE